MLRMWSEYTPNAYGAPADIMIPIDTATETQRDPPIMDDEQCPNSVYCKMVARLLMLLSLLVGLNEGLDNGLAKTPQSMVFHFHY
jgi:hypothetical protein